MALEPLCSYCLRCDVVEEAKVVDHVKSHKGDVALFYDPTNLQSLCKRCHDSDKQSEERGKTVIRFGLDGYPV